MFRLLTTLLFLGAAQFLIAQSADLFVPRNIERAYVKGTRSADGKPGPNYWQNRASYDIQVSLEPKKRLVSGQATITYTNNSPDSLPVIRFKMQHDAYRKGSMRDGDVDPADIGEGTVIQRLTYNGRTIGKDKQRRRNTFLDLQLGKGEALASGASATITVQWSYTMPSDKNATRECVCDPTTFFIAYWYPQIAVYDDYNGWASTPYSGTVEFYHDFSDYDVTISLPKGYMAWATGEWQNPGDLLEKTYLDRFNQAHTSNEVVKVFTEAELKAGGVFKKAKQHRFHYKATDVPDFTFAVSDHYNWDATSVEVDAATGRRTFVSAAYDTKSPDYPKVARIAADGIHLMSTWLPGYPFPYPCMTVFNGNDGMEYPMMVNDASVGDRDPTSLTVHEVAHTYFPFMMGINEQEYAWMDEGWASFFDGLLADSLTGRQTGGGRGYSFAAGTDTDVPLMVRSSLLRGRAYGIASYSRPQNAYLTLLDQLGYETFHRCMVAYMDRWKGKHPIPYDFFNTWNEVSGQDLNWFWKPWFFEWGHPDLGVQSVARPEGGDRDVIVIEKIGDMPVPIHLEVTYDDGSSETIHFKASVWQSGETMSTIECQKGKTVKSVNMGDRNIPDTDRRNNTWSKA
ncbi:MAG: M1 family metallopeptidase [Lewinellaceae bacterium]|nr:M1 family metallopeptidase [Saprospiraceae bacterium]MCB9332935.1 M1 family metallopeptidase [Lewinellaceae bacterium]